MYTLHGIWDSTAAGKLYVWGENSVQGKPVKSASTKSRKPKKTAPGQHPFALAAAEIRDSIPQVASSILAENLEPGTITLRLPSADDLPLASPHLIRDADAEPTPAAGLKPWQVPVVVLDAGLALDFLLALPLQPLPGMVFGNSLRYWTELAKFVLELIIQQRYFPSIQPIQPPTYRAIWAVYLSESDFDRLEEFSKAMPPVCRALVQEGAPATIVPLPQILAFLNQVCDACIRQALQLQNKLPLAGDKRKKSLTTIESWLRALTTDTGTFEIAENAELQKLVAWLEPIRPSATAAPFRTCFRLEPPTDDALAPDLWTITFHLQATDDKSLMVSADKIWSRATSDLTFLKRKFENPQERLLADLARAERIFPVLEKSLRTSHPARLNLNVTEAYQFLRETAPLLEQGGFGVLLPPWWQKANARPGVKMTVRPSGSTSTGESLLGMSSLVSYNWQIALGDHQLSAEEFLRIARLKIPLVKIRGQWVELRPEEIEKAIHFFEKRTPDGTMSLQDALRIGLTGATSETGLTVVGLEAEGWLKDLLAAFEDGMKIELHEIPAGFQGNLRPYQVRGFSWLQFLSQSGLGACLADDMGLGKTIQYIAFFLHVRALPMKPRPALIICPMSVVGNWHKEIQRFAPGLKVMVHHGPERLQGKAFIKAASKHDLVISTYALAHRDLEALSRITWRHLVLDEAQNIKNSTTRQTQAVRQIKADFRLALTGTPVENRLSELWSIMDFLNTGLLGTASDFRSRFAIPVERYRDQERMQSLKKLIQPFLLRRLKTDPTIIQDLPAKNEMKVFCNLTTEQASLYEAVVQEMLEQIEDSEGIERKGRVLATLTKLKQVCNHPAHLLQDGSELGDRSGKVMRLREMLEEVLAEKDKALIFTQFKEMGAMLRNDLQNLLGMEVLFLHGGTTKKQRDTMVQRFQSPAGPALFLLSLKAGGVGLNLTAANHVFHFDRWWNPAVENQATDRAFRIGQKKNVQVFKYICIGTLEERIDQMIENKRELAENIVGTGEAWLTELSTAQLKELLTLNRQTVGEV